MTIKEFYENVIAICDNEEVVEKAKELLKKHNEKNEKRNANSSAKKMAENAPLMAKIKDFLADKDYTPACDIKEAVEISVNKASALCRKMVENDELVSTELKISGRKVKGYKLP